MTAMPAGSSIRFRAGIALLSQLSIQKVESYAIASDYVNLMAASMPLHTYSRFEARRM